MMIYSIARMSFTFALTLVARTSVNVVKTCTLSMENAEVMCQCICCQSSSHRYHQSFSRLHSLGLRSYSSYLSYCSWAQTIHNEQRSENDYSGTCKPVTLSAARFPLPLPSSPPPPLPLPLPHFLFSPA